MRQVIRNVFMFKITLYIMFVLSFCFVMYAHKIHILLTLHHHHHHNQSFSHFPRIAREVMILRGYFKTKLIRIKNVFVVLCSANDRIYNWCWTFALLFSMSWMSALLFLFFISYKNTYLFRSRKQITKCLSCFWRYFIFGMIFK